MKKILFPFEIDQPIYREAFVYAVKLARNFGAELIMLNIFHFKVDDSITENEYNLLIKKNMIRAYLEVDRFNQFYLNSHLRVDTELRIKMNYQFLYGNLILEIRKILETGEIDLIVLPVSDQEEINQKQLEIIQDDVFEKNRTSLLVVPFKAIFQPIGKIAFATDLKELKNFSLYVSDMLRIAKHFGASIHFLHISTSGKIPVPDENEAYNNIMQIVQNNPNHVFRSLHGEDIIATVEEYVEKNKVQLLTVIKQHHNFPESLFHRSFSKLISLRSKVPVLIMREITT